MAYSDAHDPTCGSLPDLRRRSACTGAARVLRAQLHGRRCTAVPAVRPTASPSLRLFDNWAERFSVALIGLALVLAGMAYVDPVFQGLRGAMTGRSAVFWEIVTDVGKSGWV